MTKKKKISIIGSTGQIGKQTVDIIKNSKNFKISLISCEKDIKTLSDQIKNQKPAAVYIESEESKKKFKKLKFKHKFHLLENFSNNVLTPSSSIPIPVSITEIRIRS